MKSITLITLIFSFFIISYIFLHNYEHYTNIDLDDLQKNLDDIKLVGDDVYNTYIDKIYNNYFENNDNETDHYHDGSFPTYGRYKLPNQKKPKKNYKCPNKPIYIT